MTPPFDRFTDRARKAVSLARQEAQRLQHQYLGTEHLLLGLLGEGSGVAANVLRNLDVDLDKIRREVEKIVQHGTEPPPQPTNIPFTPRTKHALELAAGAATKLGHGYVGTEHLLLG